MKRVLPYILIFCLLVSIGLLGFLIKTEISEIQDFNITIGHFSNPPDELLESRNICIRDLIFLFLTGIASIVFVGIILYYLIKRPAQMTYETYKQQAEERKAARRTAHIERKRKALMEKLEKTTKALQQTDKKS